MLVLGTFLEISIILVIATVIAGIMKLLKQPLIIGHIITGILVGPFFFDLVKSGEIINVFSQIGVALLLFIVGLTLSPRVIREVGKVSLVTGLGQIIFTSIIGFFISRALGFSNIVSLYIAIALTFSSTIIIMKLLSDKHDVEKLYGKVSIGFLLVQDVVAIIILIGVSSISNELNLTNSLAQTIAYGLLLVTLVTIASMYILPGLSKLFAKSQELLYLFSIAWGLGLAGLFHYFGLSIEIGALIAGISLAMSPYHLEISSKMKPLRDFFIILFFILLGAQMSLGDVSRFIVPVILFSLFILIGNPLVVIILMGLLGYPKKTGFSAGLTVAQISEFSLILIALGVRIGHLNSEILSLVTIIGLITIAGSTYLILYSERIYPYVSRYLSIFERKSIKREKKMVWGYDIILFGCSRTGYDFLKSFRRLKKRFIVVDYNPEIIADLTRKKINYIYGDADDNEFLDELKLNKVKMVVSTIPDFDTNVLLINRVKQENGRAIILVVSYNIDESIMLYEEGATYVMMPHFLGGSYASMMTAKYGFNINKFLKEKEKHIKYLKERRHAGHEHPKTEKHR